MPAVRGGIKKHLYLKNENTVKTWPSHSTSIARDCMKAITAKDAIQFRDVGKEIKVITEYREEKCNKLDGKRKKRSSSNVIKRHLETHNN